MERTILHINVVNFYVAVARVLEPKLSGYPVAVRAGGSKSVLLDVSQEAAQSGVRRGMTADIAMRKCPDLRMVDPVPSEYDRAEKFLLKQAECLSPRAETAGPGHLFVDLTGTRRLLGPSVDVAHNVRKSIKEECRFDCAVGLSANRLVSKVATRVIKPAGLCSVIDGCEEEFMAPLPINFLPSLEQRILAQLLQFNLHLIRDLNRISAKSLATVLGPYAYEISQQSRGIDNSPVREIVAPAPFVSECLTLSEQTNNEYEIACALFHLISCAGKKIRKMGMAVQKLKIFLTYADGSRVSRCIQLRVPVHGDLTLYEMCANLLKKMFTRRVRIAQLRVDFLDLTFPYGQVDLFADNEREENLMSALDSIRDSFGDKAIKFWGRVA